MNLFKKSNWIADDCRIPKCCSKSHLAPWQYMSMSWVLIDASCSFSMSLPNWFPYRNRTYRMRYFVARKYSFQLFVVVLYTCSFSYQLVSPSLAHTSPT